MINAKELVDLVESIIEENEAYGSNVSLLSCAVNNSGDVRGIFKDVWNNRVYSFQFDKLGLSYRPRLPSNTPETLDSLPNLFDKFSDGYRSSIKVVERNDTLTKRIKKPKCGFSNYNCGFACLDIKKNCRIESDSSSKERLSKLKTIARNLAKNLGKDDVDYLEVLQIVEKIKNKGVKTEPFKLSNPEFTVVGDADVRKKLGQWTNAYKKISKLNDLNNPIVSSQHKDYINDLKRKITIEQANILNLESKVKSFDYRQSVVDDNEKYKEFTPARFFEEEYVIKFAEARKNKDIKSIAESKNRIEDAIKEIAKQEEQIKILETRKAQPNPNMSQIDQDRISAATGIVETILSLKADKEVRFGGIVDRDGNLQATYTYTHTPSGYYVDFLASAPWNCLLDHPNKKTGAGASAIEGLIREAVSRKKKGTIELLALPNAVPFYKKVGFTTKDDITQLPSMKLDAVNAKKFIEQQELKNKRDSRVDLALLTELEQLEEQALGLFSVPIDRLNFVKQWSKP